MNQDPVPAPDGEVAYREYLNGLLAGDRQACRAVFESWLAAGAELRALYQEVIQRSLYGVGELWARGWASVATEHVATAITESLQVDAAKFQQVWLNLLGNAIEHSQPGQRVWLSSHWEDRSLHFAVRDEGPGLKPEAQSRLFQPFVQAGTRKTAGERSVGLGLLITRKIVEAHGGRLWVESIPGEGATFRFALPVPPQPHSAPPAHL